MFINDVYSQSCYGNVNFIECQQMKFSWQVYKQGWITVMMEHCVAGNSTVEHITSATCRHARLIKLWQKCSYLFIDMSFCSQNNFYTWFSVQWTYVYWVTCQPSQWADTILSVCLLALSRSLRIQKNSHTAHKQYMTVNLIFCRKLLELDTYCLLYMLLYMCMLLKVRPSFLGINLKLSLVLKCVLVLVKENAHVKMSAIVSVLVLQECYSSYGLYRRCFCIQYIVIFIWHSIKLQVICYEVCMKY